MEFDYVNAWRHDILPQLRKHKCGTGSALFKELSTFPCVSQNKDLTITIPEDWTSRINAICDREDAAILAELIFAYGHWKPTQSTNGWHWRVHKVIIQTLIARGINEPRRLAELAMEKASKNYYIPNGWVDGKEPKTKEEFAFVIGKIFGVRTEYVTVNHRLKDGIQPVISGASRFGAFTIGNRHMQLSTGMYLDPRVAPCARTGNKYDDFTCDHIVVIYASKRNMRHINTNRSTLSDLLTKGGFDGITVHKP